MCSSPTLSTAFVALLSPISPAPHSQRRITRHRTLFKREHGAKKTRASGPSGSAITYRQPSCSRYRSQRRGRRDHRQCGGKDVWVRKRGRDKDAPRPHHHRYPHHGSAHAAGRPRRNAPLPAWRHHTFIPNVIPSIPRSHSSSLFPFLSPDPHSPRTSYALPHALQARGGRTARRETQSMLTPARGHAPYGDNDAILRDNAGAAFPAAQRRDARDTEVGATDGGEDRVCAGEGEVDVRFWRQQLDWDWEDGVKAIPHDAYLIHRPLETPCSRFESRVTSIRRPGRPRAQVQARPPAPRRSSLVWNRRLIWCYALLPHTLPCTTSPPLSRDPLSQLACRNQKTRSTTLELGSGRRRRSIARTGVRAAAFGGAARYAITVCGEGACDGGG
ncbi:hypothetical protein DFH06DRAFT_175968 [Mycena polygramma]|nr:hypothetical protein DFH06DRAFT_175968 [Mycena polygramma]